MFMAFFFEINFKIEKLKKWNLQFFTSISIILKKWGKNVKDWGNGH